MGNSNTSDSFVEQFVLLLKSRVPLIIVVTPEEQRTLELVNEARKKRDPKSWLVSWDLAEKFAYPIESDPQKLPEAPEPKMAMDKILELSKSRSSNGDIYVLRDFHDLWKSNPEYKRRLKSLATKLPLTKSSVVVTTPHRDIPAELRDVALVIELDLPTASDLRLHLDKKLEQIEKSDKITIKLDGNGRQQLANAAVGLSRSQADRAFNKALVNDGILDDQDVVLVMEEKKSVVRESGALEFYSPGEGGQDAVGGLEVLKGWLDKRSHAFSEEAKNYGLPSPRGLALIGIPGTGKSLSAKLIARQWRMPLLRLDIGAVFGSLVGESEEKIRKALKLAELVAPCVLWIDELEKSLSSGDSDGGTSKRVLGTFLTWMQEKRSPIFVVATANDVSALPPELLRRGRFDEIFFLDLPTSVERGEIVKVHLGKRRRQVRDFELDRIVAASEGYVGAEIEQAVIDALYSAFDDGRREVNTDDIINALVHLVPLSKSQWERIKELRGWLADGRARSASYEEAQLAIDNQVNVNLEFGQ